MLVEAAQSHVCTFYSGVDVQEAEEDCLTEATTPTSFQPVSQTQTHTVAPAEPASEEVAPSQEEVRSAGEDTSPADKFKLPEEETRPVDPAQQIEERDSLKREEPEGNADSSSQSVDELLADWQEDLEAFQQMEKDEL